MLVFQSGKARRNTMFNQTGGGIGKCFGFDCPTGQQQQQVQPQAPVQPPVMTSFSDSESTPIPRDVEWPHESTPIPRDVEWPHSFTRSESPNNLEATRVIERKEQDGPQKEPSISMSDLQLGEGKKKNKSEQPASIFLREISPFLPKGLKEGAQVASEIIDIFPRSKGNMKEFIKYARMMESKNPETREKGKKLMKAYCKKYDCK